MATNKARYYIQIPHVPEFPIKRLPLPLGQQEESLWAPALLSLCLDDSPGVRGEAIKAARSAVRCLQGRPGIATWVLGKLNDGSLYHGMDR